MLQILTITRPLPRPHRLAEEPQPHDVLEEPGAAVDATLVREARLSSLVRGEGADSSVPTSDHVPEEM
ncbi:hypothetical protein GCM10025866_14620 [Naasia aerilata]|uniref:Uncharacterized protein n=1 Tax=Naasia aerilata TaxID=1162966 RepID=A0ABN6XKT6_9MICO|nr:hypothetical protein GCM10025866_14620 [Naasia aerilata]